MAAMQMVSKWEVPEHPEIEWALRTGYPSWMQEKGSEPTAAGGGGRKASEWQRSKFCERIANGKFRAPQQGKEDEQKGCG